MIRLDDFSLQNGSNPICEQPYQYIKTTVYFLIVWFEIIIKYIYILCNDLFSFKIIFNVLNIITYCKHLITLNLFFFTGYDIVCLIYI